MSAVLFLGWPAGAAAVGCRQLIGIDERSPCDSLGPRGSACSVCEAASCCDEALACGDEPACSRARDCLDACAGDGDCESGCRQHHQADLELPPAVQLLACRARSCSEACDAGCGFYLYPTVACADCAEAECCDEARACGENDACRGLSACSWGCAEADVGCLGECQRLHHDGEALSSALASCTIDRCKADCFPPPIEPDWTCAPEGLPISPGDDLVVALRFVNDDGATARTVYVCPRTEPNCTTDPIDAAGGQANITIPRDFDGYLHDHGVGMPAITDFGSHLRLVADAPVPLLSYVRRTAAVWNELRSLLPPLEPGKGFLHYYSRDCDDVPQVVSYELEPLPPDATAFYGYSGELGDGPTLLGSSHAGFLNLDEGSYTLRMYDEQGSCVGQAETDVAADTETHIDGLEPSPCD